MTESNPPGDIPDSQAYVVFTSSSGGYTFYHAGQRVDLTLSGPTNADNVDPWRIVSSSLRER